MDGKEHIVHDMSPVCVCGEGPITVRAMVSMERPCGAFLPGTIVVLPMVGEAPHKPAKLRAKSSSVSPRNPQHGI